MVIFVYIDLAGLMDKGFHGYQGDSEAMGPAATGVIHACMHVCVCVRVCACVCTCMRA